MRISGIFVLGGGGGYGGYGDDWDRQSNYQICDGFRCGGGSERRKFPPGYRNGYGEFSNYSGRTRRGGLLGILS
ncbi:MAG: hypothetical protein M3460_22875 [Actinomycetota bacterium]|nr:hypothetical protein [Actinomycetota bacterium]